MDFNEMGEFCFEPNARVLHQKGTEIGAEGTCAMVGAAFALLNGATCRAGRSQAARSCRRGARLRVVIAHSVIPVRLWCECPDASQCRSKV